MLKNHKRKKPCLQNNFAAKRSKNLEISSESEDYTEDEKAEESTESEDDTELQKAKKSIERLRAKITIDNSDDEEVDDILADQLKDDALKKRGRLQKTIAAKYQPPNSSVTIKGHRRTITCIACASDQVAFSAGKDSTIIKYNIKEGTRTKIVKGGKKGANHKSHSTHILSMAVSSDGRFLATGDASNSIYIWNAETMERRHVFRGHRGPVSALAFRMDSYQLFSGSHDRSIRHWNLENMAYVESLFGHEQPLTGLASGYRERCVSSGGRDGSIRVWKIVEESQLVFNLAGKQKNGLKASVECIALINDDHFLSGSDDCSIQLWNVNKVKPVCSASCAVPGEEALMDVWVSSLAALHNTDLVVSGTRNGSISLWRCANNFTVLVVLFRIPTIGVINSLSFDLEGKKLLVAIGREHKWGRWWTVKEAKDSLIIYSFDHQPT